MAKKPTPPPASAVISEDIQVTLDRMNTDLSALGYKFNLPAQVRDQYIKRPLPVIGGGAGFVVLIAGIVVTIVLLTRRGKGRQ